MSPSNLAALFGAMVLLAALPSVSVLAVTARAASHGFLQGAWTALGIVTGDIVFILLALFGLALLVETLGDLFYLVNYLAAAYLLWLAHALLCAPTAAASAPTLPGSARSSFMTGLLITLGDQKAVLFYLGFLPAFLDLSRVTALQAGLVIAITCVAVGGVKLGYAAAAARAGRALGPRAGQWLNRLAGALMIGAAVALIMRS